MPGGDFESRRRCISTADVVECATASRDKSRSRPYTHRMPPCGQPLPRAYPFQGFATTDCLRFWLHRPRWLCTLSHRSDLWQGVRDMDAPTEKTIGTSDPPTLRPPNPKKHIRLRSKIFDAKFFLRHSSSTGRSARSGSIRDCHGSPALNHSLSSRSQKTRFRGQNASSPLAQPRP